MTPDPIIGCRLFVDGVVRPVFLDDTSDQYVINGDGHTRCYGHWLPSDGDEPMIVIAAESSVCVVFVSRLL